MLEDNFFLSVIKYACKTPVEYFLVKCKTVFCSSFLCSPVRCCWAAARARPWWPPRSTRTTTRRMTRRTSTRRPRTLTRTRRLRPRLRWRGSSPSTSSLLMWSDPPWWWFLRRRCGDRRRRSRCRGNCTRMRKRISWKMIDVGKIVLKPSKTFTVRKGMSNYDE